MKRRAFSAAVVYMPCQGTGISGSRSVPASCKSDCWIPRLNVLGIVCASGPCSTHVKWDRRSTGKDVGLGLSKGEFSREG
jgi:hypothetical protein